MAGVNLSLRNLLAFLAALALGRFPPSTPCRAPFYGARQIVLAAASKRAWPGPSAVTASAARTFPWPSTGSKR